MDRITIRKEITALVNSIKSQSDILVNEKYPSQMELELFLHKVEKLYQKSIVFNHLSAFDGFEESEPNPSRMISSAPVTRPTHDVTKEKPVEKVPVPVSAPVPEKKSESSPLPKEQPSTGHPVQRTSLPDLKSTIGINDKFQFTNELFKGNMHEFNIAIEQLNASETHESALAYLTGLRRLYNWDDENETVKRWLTIIERRYS